MNTDCIGLDAYPFLVFSDVTCHIEDTEIGVSCHLIVRRLNSSGKYTRIILVACHTWKCVPTAISAGVDISEVPGHHLSRQMSSQ